jgi:hypothetical protein
MAGRMQNDAHDLCACQRGHYQPGVNRHELGRALEADENARRTQNEQALKKFQGLCPWTPLGFETPNPQILKDKDFPRRLNPL